MVIWTRHALAQLRHIHDYIAADSPLYAKRVSETFVTKCQGLDALPHLGRMLPELNDTNVRELSLYSYRIIYEIQANQIVVLAIVHKRKDLQPDEVGASP